MGNVGVGDFDEAPFAGLVGNKPSDLIAGLWPSDHAGVVATMRLRPRS